MKVSQKLIKDITGTFATQVIIMLSALVINKILSNSLSVEDFGKYNIIKRSSAVISFSVLGGLGISIPKFISSYTANDEQVRVSSLLRASLLYFIFTCSVIICIIFILGKDFQEYIIGSSSINLCVIVCLYSVANAFSTYVTVYYRGYNNFIISNLNAILVGVLIVVPLLPSIHTSVEYVYQSWTVIYVLLSVIFFVFIKNSPLRVLKKIKSKQEDIKSEFRLLIKYSLPRLLGDIFLFSFSAFPLVYIGALENDVDVAYYSVGLTFVTLATPIFSFVGVILLPLVSSKKSKGEEESRNSNKFVDMLAVIYTFSALFIIVILGIGMPFFIKLFYSSDYMAVTNLARILILSVLPQAYYLLYRNPIDASNNFPYNTLTIGFCLLLLIILFVNSDNLTQYAWSYVGVSCLQGFLSFLIWKKIKLSQ